MLYVGSFPVTFMFTCSVVVSFGGIYTRLIYDATQNEPPPSLQLHDIFFKNWRPSMLYLFTRPIYITHVTVSVDADTSMISVRT